MCEGMTMEQIKRNFNALRANVVRSRITISAVFLSLYDENIYSKEELLKVEKRLNGCLHKRIRQSDFIFKYPEKCRWLIVLAASGEEEAKIFLNRLFSETRENCQVQLSASIAEIVNADGEYEELVEISLNALEKSKEKGPWNMEYISKYKTRSLQTIKLSILEEDDIIRNVLHKTIENMNITNLQLEVKLFKDGYDFMESDWYISSHTHIIIMNDILPRQNGIDVLHRIRKLPNNKKYIVYMMTKRNSEEDIIYAYESGVDEYLVKPFNLRLFEVQLKRTFERLWS